jgi:hypothetical protein
VTLALAASVLLTGDGLPTPAWFVCAPPGAAPARGVVQLQPGGQLFLDKYLIGGSRGFRRVVTHPLRRRSPVVSARRARNRQPYVTVVRSGHRFRLWYDAARGRHGTALGVLESDDGIRWRGPLVLRTPRDIVYGASVVDHGVRAAGHGRYLLGYWNDGLRLARSRDGLRWTPVAGGPAVRSASDIVSIARDAAARRYLAFFKTFSTAADQYHGTPAYAPRDRRRLVAMSASRDGRRWSAPKRIFLPDRCEARLTEFYGLGGVTRHGNALVGFLRVLRDDLAATAGRRAAGIGYSVLAWSWDGRRWFRDRRPFLDRNPRPGTFDHAMAWADSAVDSGERTLVYYGAYALGHKIRPDTSRTIGVASIPRGRFVALRAPRAGRLVTTRLSLPHGDLRIDAEGARVDVAILDARRRPLPGFGFADCAVGRGGRVACRGGQPPSGRPLRIAIALRRGDLYGFGVFPGPRTPRTTRQ